MDGDGERGEEVAAGEDVGLAEHDGSPARLVDGHAPGARIDQPDGNGARLERLNWLGDTSDKGLREAHGLMVNYLYDLRFIEANHEAFANHGTIVASAAVRRYLPASQPSPEKVG